MVSTQSGVDGKRKSEAPTPQMLVWCLDKLYPYPLQEDNVSKSLLLVGVELREE